MPAHKKSSLAHSLGEFFGHIWKAAKTDPAKPMIARKTVEEQRSRTPSGEVILRRTTIEEVEVRRDPAGTAPPTPRKAD